MGVDEEESKVKIEDDEDEEDNPFESMSTLTDKKNEKKEGNLFFSKPGGHK